MLSGHGRRRVQHPRHCCPALVTSAVQSCGHALVAMSKAPARTERYKSLPQAVAVTNCIHHMNSTIRVTHSPLDPPEHMCEDAQKWGNHVSLSSPSIRQYRAEYYRMHYLADVPEEDRLHPHTLWSTSASASVLKRAAPREVKVRVCQLRGLWEYRASQFRGDQPPRLIISLGVPGRTSTRRGRRMQTTFCLPHA